MDSGSREFEIEGLLEETAVVVVDPSRLFREGMKRLFETTRFRIVAEAQRLDEVMPELRRGASETRLLIVKWCADDPDFLRNIIELTAVGSGYQIVAINDEVECNDLIGALRSGVKAFLLKDLSPDALIESLRLVEMGETVFPTELGALLISGSVSFSQRRSSAAIQAEASITNREMSILRLLIRGEPNKIIAFQLNVTESTIKVQMKFLFKKINVGNRTKAAIWALDRGLDRVVDDEPEMRTDCASRTPNATADMAMRYD
ncbi:response regulator transcription factor [Fodinicurvata sp. EGI_FJ10296]|uniref:response regulator transcription factor n=1 Tax=Fodinicurvata sp. EGI_FJ10296 TaxID=3231908 RepID=UPI003454EB59